jgi:hypothetical protein
MKRSITLIGVCYLSLLGLLTGCSQKPAPLKEGIIWKVVWSEGPNTEASLFRVKTPQPGGGEYGIDMYGALYPDFLEVRRIGDPDSHFQIIPLREIIQLEFGDGGVSFSKP